MRRRCGASRGECSREGQPGKAGPSPAAVLRRRLREAEARWGLLEGASGLLVAVSGGPDSVALLHLLHSSAKDRGWRLRVAHLHHGLRGAEADGDAEYVGGLAEGLGLALVSERADAAAHAQERGLSLEMAAREVRYGFLERVAESGERVALGHTASDRVENVLMHLLRGTGLAGLRGLPAARGVFVRPLLTAWRSETESYCRHHGLTPRQDATNLDPHHALRNRLRLELLPLLRAQYNPAVDEALLRLAEAAEAEWAWTAPQVEAAAQGLLEAEGEGVSLELAGLRALPAGLRQRLWRVAWERLTGDAGDLYAEHVAALEGLLEAGRGAALDLPRDIRARLGYNNLSLVRGAQPPGLALRELAEPGEVELPELGARLVVEQLAGPPPEPGPVRGRQVVLEAAGVAWPLQVRSWRPGDRLNPLGLGGHKKLQDVFTDLKVPREARGRVPVVTDAAGAILWVAGCAVSEQGRMTEQTREFLRLTFHGELPWRITET